MTHDSLITHDQPHSGNSPASRDIALHMHPYTNPAALRELGPHIMAEGQGVFVVDDDCSPTFKRHGGAYLRNNSMRRCNALHRGR